MSCIKKQMKQFTSYNVIINPLKWESMNKVFNQDNRTLDVRETLRDELASEE